MMVPAVFIRYSRPSNSWIVSLQSFQGKRIFFFGQSRLLGDSSGVRTISLVYKRLTFFGFL